MDARLSALFVVAGGSVIGADHRSVLRNNQDAFALYAGDDGIVAVVTDGCSQGRFSEVGARLGAAWLSRHVPAIARETLPAEGIACAATTGLIAYLGDVVRGLSAEVDLAGAINDMLLFTFVVAVVRSDRALVFGVGDGAYAVDGRTVVLDPGPDNAPPYAAYGLLGPAPEPRVHFTCETGALTSLVIATDGAIDLIANASQTLADGTLQGGLDRFAEDPRYARNASLVQKRLVVIGERNGRLRDDTTVALIRRHVSRPALPRKEDPWTSS